MNRRGFLGALIGGVATAAAVQTFPFRVFSFPAEIVKPAAYSTYVMGKNAVISQYFDFASFPEILTETAIDPIVYTAGKEFVYRRNVELNQWMELTN